MSAQCQTETVGGESADTDENLSPQDKFRTGVFFGSYRQHNWCIQETNTNTNT